MFAEDVDRFASALDREDYADAARLLDERCVYHARDRTVIGREAILEDYRARAEAARDRFEAVRFAHAVEKSARAEFSILYTDEIRHGGRRFVHRCKQKVVFSEAGLIDMIIHRDLPGERERFEAFLEETGA